MHFHLTILMVLICMVVCSKAMHVWCTPHHFLSSSPFQEQTDPPEKGLVEDIEEEVVQIAKKIGSSSR